jgi:threonyl-tRNA synthetase
MKTKIANAEQMKVHTMLVIGNRDMEASAVSLRVHGKGNLVRSRAMMWSQKFLR